MRFWSLGVVAVSASTLVIGCVAMRPMHLRTNALEYLYPVGSTEGTESRDVTLRVPVRVGLAFAPGAAGREDPFTEVQRQALLSRVAEAFRDRDYIGSIEVIPSNYLSARGGFEELDRLAKAFGVDLMVLVSYDQAQFRETTNRAWTYLTVVGAFAIEGEKNETRTLMDAVVYDISSRTFLFRAAGDSSLAGRSTPVKVERELRTDSEQGFEVATDDLVAELELALDVFRTHVASGTVRGPGTPAIEVVSAGNPAGTGGAGALGAPELVGAVLLAGLAAARRPRTKA
jgi:rhombotail lipoprotein